VVVIQLVAAVVSLAAVSIYSVKQTITAKGRVSGILYTVEDSTAIINGQLLKKGDTLDGVTILEIERDRVEFEKKAERWYQRIGERPNSAWAQDVK